MDKHPNSKDNKAAPNQSVDPGFEHLIQAFKTRDCVAAEYGIHPRTLARRLEQLKIELPTGGLFPKHQRLIYEALGTPPFAENQK
jgi:hypothetical protein